MAKIDFPNVDIKPVTNSTFISCEVDLPVTERQIVMTEKRIVELQQDMAQLQRQYSEQARILYNLRSASTIRKLPAEILAEIFRCILHLHLAKNPEGQQITIPWHSDRHPWQLDLAQVCSAWRLVALGCSFLWANVMVIATAFEGFCDEDEDEEIEGPGEIEGMWEYLDGWVSRLKRARQLLPSHGPLRVGIDVDESEWAFDQVCDLAATHLYDPLLEQGRSVTAVFKGCNTYVSGMIRSEFRYPELLEHVIIDSSGPHGDEEIDKLLDTICEGPIQTKLSRLELIGDCVDILCAKTTSVEESFPWNRLSHFILHDNRNSFCWDEDTTPLEALFSVPKFCDNLVHLTFIINYDHAFSINPITTLEDVWYLPSLRTLIVCFDFENLFRYLKLPSLSSLEIRNTRKCVLNAMPEFISRSECNIQSFAEHKPDTPFEIYQRVFEQFLLGLCPAKTFKTSTLLTQQDVEKIATGAFLPCVEVFHFCTQVSAEVVIDILKPRFRFHRKFADDHDTSIITELAITYFGSRLDYPSFPFYVSGTSVRVIYKGAHLNCSTRLQLTNYQG